MELALEFVLVSIEHGARNLAVFHVGLPVTATGVVTGNSGWFTEEQLQLANTATITALTVTITVQRTSGVNASLGCGSDRAFAAQMSGNGTAHPTAGDTFAVTGTAGGGQAINLTGHF